MAISRNSVELHTVSYTVIVWENRTSALRLQLFVDSLCFSQRSSSLQSNYGKMAGQTVTPLTNPYITALDEDKEYRSKQLGALFRRVVQQRRALNLDHRKLITEKRTGRLRRAKPVHSSPCISVPEQPSRNVLEVSLSSDSSDLGEKGDLDTADESASKPVSRATAATKCDMAVNSTFEADTAYLRVLPPKSAACARRNHSQCRAIQLTLEVEGTRRRKDVSPWARMRTNARSRTRYMESAREEAKPKSLSMHISPQLRRKQAADRQQHSQATARVLRLYNHIQAWRQGSPPESVVPSVFTSNLRWPANPSVFRTLR